jgi:hypothetical protein
MALISIAVRQPRRTRYLSLGATYFDQPRRTALAARAKRRLEALGDEVTIEEAA